MNAHRLLILLTLPLLISGCASLKDLFGTSVKPIEVQTKAVERTKLNIKEPAPLKTSELTWIIVTPENADAVFADMKSKNVDLVLFAITDEGYEQLALTMAEIRNYIATQRSIVIKYKQYYEPETSEGK